MAMNRIQFQPGLSMPAFIKDYGTDYLISQVKTGLSSLALKRQLGVSYPTAWLIHHKLMQAMAEREQCYVLEGKVRLDDAYLGGERSGGKAGRGSGNKVSFVAAVSLTEEGHPLRARLTPVPGFTLKAVAAWARGHLAPGVDVASSDSHTVKPWFHGRLDFSPPVHDLTGTGFPLIGGRLDYLAGKPVPAFVYRHKQHEINLFVLPQSASENPDDIMKRDGYQLVHWRADGFDWWAVSDLNKADLARFRGLLLAT